MTSPQTPHPVDRHVGRMMKLRRLELNLSQQEIAKLCDISFQQVQKYEHGINRVSASMLVQVARALDIAPGHFVNDAPGAPGAKELSEGDVAVQELVAATLGGLEAIRRFAKLTGPQRTTLLTLMDQLAEPAAPPPLRLVGG